MVMKFEVGVPDLTYWKEAIKCQWACPVHTDARGYVRAIAGGNMELAYLIARGPNPIASMCGQVCGSPCEAACRRGELDRPVAIRALKRFVCEQFGPEARTDGGESLVEYLKEAAQRVGGFECRDKDELLPLLQGVMSGDVPPVKDKSVGIIGSGPAGLGAAHDLALLGFKVTIYEMEPVLAGMLAVGVPEYRLRRDLIAAEVEVITSMGVEAVTNCCVGRDVTLPELRERHDAVVIAVGMKRSRMLDMPGADAEGVLGGVEYLREVWLGKAPEIGPRVVIIGGGSVAYDVSRTALRFVYMDAARTARRDPTVSTVDLFCLEAEEEMLADDFEIRDGDEEGVVRHHRWGPKEVLVGDDGKVRGVLFRRCERLFDDDGRFNPVYDDSVMRECECDHVLFSIGQSLDLGFIDAERDGLKLRPNGSIECNPETGQTDAPGVFLAGDLATGPRLMVHAVASGKAVARSIYEAATGRAIRMEDVELHFPIPDFYREWDYEKQPRLDAPTISVEERLQATDRQVELNYAPEQAQCEAGRCLDCGVNTIFDGTRCILCGGCADVCPERCLRLVPISQIEGNEALDTVDTLLEGVAVERSSAIVKDETICIRCALCAERCPTGAITMERFRFEENLICRT